MSADVVPTGVTRERSCLLCGTRTVHEETITTPPAGWPMLGWRCVRCDRGDPALVAVLDEVERLAEGAARILLAEGWSRTSGGWTSPDLRRHCATVWGALELAERDLRGAVLARRKDVP